jgi:hypothetical protein
MTVMTLKMEKYQIRRQEERDLSFMTKKVISNGMTKDHLHQKNLGLKMEKKEKQSLKRQITKEKVYGMKTKEFPWEKLLKREKVLGKE